MKSKVHEKSSEAMGHPTTQRRSGEDVVRNDGRSVDGFKRLGASIGVQMMGFTERGIRAS